MHFIYTISLATAWRWLLGTSKSIFMLKELSMICFDVCFRWNVSLRDVYIETFDVIANLYMRSRFDEMFRWSIARVYISSNHIFLFDQMVSMNKKPEFDERSFQCSWSMTKWICLAFYRFAAWSSFCSLHLFLLWSFRTKLSLKKTYLQCKWLSQMSPPWWRAFPDHLSVSLYGFRYNYLKKDKCSI